MANRSRVLFIPIGVLFIFGLKGMSSPASARRGIVWAGYGIPIAKAGLLWPPRETTGEGPGTDDDGDE